MYVLSADAWTAEPIDGGMRGFWKRPWYEVIRSNPDKASGGQTAMVSRTNQKKPLSLVALAVLPFLRQHPSPHLNKA